MNIDDLLKIPKMTLRKRRKCQFLTRLESTHERCQDVLKSLIVNGVDTQGTFCAM